MSLISRHSILLFLATFRIFRVNTFGSPKVPAPVPPPAPIQEIDAGSLSNLQISMSESNFGDGQHHQNEERIFDRKRKTKPPPATVGGRPP